MWQGSHPHQIAPGGAVEEPVNIFRRNDNSKGNKVVATILPTSDELEVVEQIQARFGTIIFGAPTRCHDCGGYGMVERLDDTTGVIDNRCPACSNEWRITRAAIRQVNHARCIDLTSSVSGVIARLPALSRSEAPVARLTSNGLDGRPVGDGILVRNLLDA